MKFNLKRTSALFLAVTMSLSLAACKGNDTTDKTGSAGSTKEGTTATDESKSGNSTQADAGVIDTSEFVTISHLSLGDTPENGQYQAVSAEWNAYLKEKVNANLEIQYVPWTDYMTKYNLLLASGTELDLVNSASDWLDMWPNAQKGAFMELDELLPVYAPITWSEVTAEHWDEVRYNGDIIAIPEDQYTQWINHGFMYRDDWAKEFGITEPITTWEGIETYLQAVKDNKGSEGVIPFDVPAQDVGALWGGWINSYTPIIAVDPLPQAARVPWFMATSSEKWWEVVSPYFYKKEDGTDLLLEFATEMKQWGDAGFWREDVLNNKNDLWTQFRAGLSGLHQKHTQDYVGNYNEMERSQPGANMQFMPWSGPSKNLVKMSLTHGATVVANSSKNPERALMVYDLIRNDDTMYKLFCWGKEGVQYVVNADNQRERPEGYSDETDKFQSNFWGGRMDKFDLAIPNADMYPDWKTIYDEYDTYAAEYVYGRMVFDKTSVETEISALTDVTQRLLPAIAAGKAGDPAKAVEELRTQLKSAGFDKLQAEVEAQMAAYKTLIGE